MSTDYAIERTLTNLSFGDAIEKTTEALNDEGFGVLTEIDIQATMKKKLDADLPAYVILGACNPGLAHRALSAEPQIGLLLPCNVVVREVDDGVSVSAIDPHAMFSVVDNEDVGALASEVEAGLRRALDSI